MKISSFHMDDFIKVFFDKYLYPGILWSFNNEVEIRISLFLIFNTG